MERINHDDGSFTIRISKRELAEIVDQKSWLENLIEEDGHDPETTLVTFTKSLSKYHVIISVEPDAISGGE